MRGDELEEGGEKGKEKGGGIQLDGGSGTMVARDLLVLLSFSGTIATHRSRQMITTIFPTYRRNRHDTRPRCVSA